MGVIGTVSSGVQLYRADKIERSRGNAGAWWSVEKSALDGQRFSFKQYPV